MNTGDMKDIEIKCADCGRVFNFTVDEQKFFKDKSFVNPDGTVRQPKRCRNCRRQRKNDRDGGRIADAEAQGDRDERRARRGMPDGPRRGSR